VPAGDIDRYLLVCGARGYQSARARAQQQTSRSPPVKSIDATNSDPAPRIMCGYVANNGMLFYSMEQLVGLCLCRRRKLMAADAAARKTSRTPCRVFAEHSTNLSAPICPATFSPRSLLTNSGRGFRDDVTTGFPDDVTAGGRRSTLFAQSTIGRRGQKWRTSGSQRSTTLSRLRRLLTL